MHLVAGTHLKEGQYLLNHVLDQQGIGWTYRATQTQLQQTVLIKTLNPTLRSHPQFTQICQDFILRSRQLSRLRHPSLVRVLDSFTDLQDMPFVVLEYLQGISLNDWMNDRKRGEAEVIQLLRQMSHVLTYLQQHNLPHANLKPRNILYSSDSTNPEKNRLVLVGFAPSLRLSEMIAKRNPYSAPEFHQSHVTSTSDLYSLAGLLYYCLTQHPPAETSIETDDLRSVVDHRFPLLSLLKPGAQRLLRSASQLNSSDRPATPELWLSQLSKSRQTAAKSVQTQNQTQNQTQIQAPTSTQTSAETHIQAPLHPPQSIDISQKPTYLQDVTRLSDASRPNTQIQPPSTQVQEPQAQEPQAQEPATRSNLAPPDAPPPPIRTLTPQKPSSRRNSLPEQLPRYRTKPVTAFSESFEERPSPAPARYIPDQPLKAQEGYDRRRSHPPFASRSNYLPSPRVLKLTLLFATLAGLAFGIVLRIQASQRPGSSFFHTGQSFPPREWKGSLTPDAEVTKDVFIEPGSQSPSQSRPPSPNPPSANPEPANSELANPPSANPPSANPEPANQFPIRSKSFDPDDVLIPELSPATASPSSETSSSPEPDPVPPSASSSTKPKKSP